MEIAFLIGRIIFGSYFLLNAWNHFAHSDSLTAYAESKGVTSARGAVFVSGVLLLLGGLGVVFGIAPYASLLFLIVFLVSVTFKMHAFWKATDPSMRMGDQVNFYKNLALIGALLMLYAVEVPWAYNVLQ